MRITLISCIQLNPYVNLLQQGIQSAESTVTCQQRPTLSLRWLRADRPDVVHLHWAEHLCRSEHWHRRLRCWAEAMASLMWLQRHTQPLVYTVHNLVPHSVLEPGQARHPWMSQVLIAAILRQAAAFHVHDEATEVALRELVGSERRVVVIPHGHYIGAYPDTCSRTEARAWLGVPENTFVYVSLGQVRPYKGLENLIEAFTTLPEADVRLVIAGHPHNVAYAAALEARARLDSRILCRWGYVPPDEVQYFLRGADVAVLPYQQATTSGAALLALSFGLPIIAPRLGPFVTTLAGRRGLLYDPASTTGLADALARARQLDLQTARADALAYARAQDWTSIGRQFVALYREVVR